MKGVAAVRGAHPTADPPAPSLPRLCLGLSLPGETFP